jgi:hypothetical protein
MPKTKRPSDHQAFLDELADLWPLAKGSLTEVRKPCIRPTCPACREGRRHKAIFFSFPKDGRRVCRYVPAVLAPVLRQALTNGRRLERRLAELGEALLEAYRKNRSRKKA